MVLALSVPSAQLDRPAERVEAAAFVMALRARGIRDTGVLGAMERVPRELFAPRRFADLSRTDVSLPLPCGQTMTAPGTVAAMLVALEVKRGQRVLEVGTGSGYVTALLAKLGCRVHTIERFATLAESAAGRFAIAGVAESITAAAGDGLAPDLPSGGFERILLNGAVASVPAALTALLAAGGRLVGAAAGDGFPRLVRIERAADGVLRQTLGGALRIAPLVAGAAVSL
jgi:protein-L-isoaspartate(D-aspartate) O-methyltransferase